MNGAATSACSIPSSAIADQYEVLRAAALGEALPLKARSGLMLFLRRGMWGWAQALTATASAPREIFLAGVASPHRRVRAYINDVLLGDTVTSPAGRFLIEAERDVAAGNHIIRVEVLGPDGVEVIAGATVPFEREPGEVVAAVAPTALNATVPAPVPQDTTMERGALPRPKSLPLNSRVSRTP